VHIGTRSHVIAGAECVATSGLERDNVQRTCMALLSESQNAWLCLAGIDCHASKWLGREVEHSFFT
jgi:hypothetical protein